MTGMPILAIGADRTWRARMRRLFAGRSGMRWLGAYACGEARPMLREPPGVLLLDGDDAQVERDRRRPRLPAPSRLYFFRCPRLDSLRASLHAGARGCLDKEASADAVLRAVTAATSGLFVMSPSLVLELRQERAHSGRPLPPAVSEGGRWLGLTERQRQIVDCVVAGMSNKQIARTLQISPETVKTHLQHVFEREGVHGRIALLAEYRQVAYEAPQPIRESTVPTPATAGEQAWPRR